MKTIRLLYPDHVSGGLDTYYFGANLMRYILPENQNQKLVRVAVKAPDGKEKAVTEGITAEDEVIASLKDAQVKIAAERPDRIITIGGNCLVSLAPFDYLHGIYENTGIIWIDAHPDVSTVNDGYPFAHAMVLGSLLGGGAEPLRKQMKNPSFAPDQLFLVAFLFYGIDKRRDRSSTWNGRLSPQDAEMEIPDSCAGEYCAMDRDCCVDNELNFKNVGREINEHK